MKNAECYSNLMTAPKEGGRNESPMLEHANSYLSAKSKNTAHGLEIQRIDPL